MRKYLTTPLVLLFLAAVISGQESSTGKANGPVTTNTPAIVVSAITPNSTPIELARAALAAQGGDKFKNLKSMMLVGSVDLYPPNSAQSIPGKFAMVTAGDRVRIDIDARPIFAFKQIYDGQQSFSSIPGVQMPPASKFGLPVLAKFDQPGYTVSGLPDKNKFHRFLVFIQAANTPAFSL